MLALVTNYPVTDSSAVERGIRKLMVRRSLCPMDVKCPAGDGRSWESNPGLLRRAAW